MTDGSTARARSVANLAAAEAKQRAERIALGKTGPLRIGIAVALSWHGMVTESFQEFWRRQPDAQLVLHHLLSHDQVEAVLSGRLDAGFVAAITPWHKGVRARQNLACSACRPSLNKTRKDSTT